MKAYKHLYPQICSFQNLLAAFWKARRHKSARPYVAANDHPEIHIINNNNGVRVCAQYVSLRCALGQHVIRSRAGDRSRGGELQARAPGRRLSPAK